MTTLKAGTILILILIMFSASAKDQKEVDASSDANTQWTGKSGEVVSIELDESVVQKLSKKRFLVVYYSRSGNTEKTAGAIAAALRADIEKIEEVDQDRSGVFGYMGAGWDAMRENIPNIKKTEKNIADYDYIIIGTPVWAWNMAPAVRAFITKHKKSFKKVMFFVTSGGTKAEKIIPDMEKIADQTAVTYLGLLEKDIEDEKQFVKKIKSFIIEISEKTGD